MTSTPFSPGPYEYFLSTESFVSPLGHTPSPYDAWGELASKLENEHFRAEYVCLSSKLIFLLGPLIIRGFTALFVSNLLA